jgi:hypothetical protein
MLWKQNLFICHQNVEYYPFTRLPLMPYKCRQGGFMDSKVIEAANVFGGKRVARSLYKDQSGLIFHADLGGCG